MERSEIPFLSVAELGRRMQAGEVSPVEAVDAYLERIEQVDGRLNSYITVCGEAARQEAQTAAAELAAGRVRGPLHGIPLAVKDQFLTNGVRTTAGSNLLWDFVPDEDAVVVSRLKAAGAVLLGKLNLSEFALGESFHHPAGTPRNPWDTSRNPGISSSGSAAAVAAHLCAASLGEDTGGSTRIPAAWSGLAGLRPTWGLVSRRGVFGVSWSMDTVGPLARSVEDCAIVFQAIAGYDPSDPYSWNRPTPDYRRELEGGIAGLRVGVLREKVAEGELPPETRAAVEAAVAQLAGPGGGSTGDFHSGGGKRRGGVEVHHRRRRGGGASGAAARTGGGIRPQHAGAAADRRPDSGNGLPESAAAAGSYPPGGIAGAGRSGCNCAAHHAGAGAQDCRRAGNSRAGGRPQPDAGGAQLHRGVQPGGAAGLVPSLRLHRRGCGQPADAAVAATGRPPDGGCAAAARGPRLPAGHRLAHPPPAAVMLGGRGRGWAAGLPEQAAQVAPAVDYAGYSHGIAADGIEDDVGQVGRMVGANILAILRAGYPDIRVLPDNLKACLYPVQHTVGDFVSGGFIVVAPYLQEVS